MLAIGDVQCHMCKCFVLLGLLLAELRYRDKPSHDGSSVGIGFPSHRVKQVTYFIQQIYRPEQPPFDTFTAAFSKIKVSSWPKQQSRPDHKTKKICTRGISLRLVSTNVWLLMFHEITLRSMDASVLMVKGHIVHSANFVSVLSERNTNKGGGKGLHGTFTRFENSVDVTPLLFVASVPKSNTYRHISATDPPSPEAAWSDYSPPSPRCR